MSGMPMGAQCLKVALPASKNRDGPILSGARKIAVHDDRRKITTFKF